MQQPINRRKLNFSPVIVITQLHNQLLSDIDHAQQPDVLTSANTSTKSCRLQQRVLPPPSLHRIDDAAAVPVAQRLCSTPPAGVSALPTQIRSTRRDAATTLFMMCTTCADVQLVLCSCSSNPAQVFAARFKAVTRLKLGVCYSTLPRYGTQANRCCQRLSIFEAVPCATEPCRAARGLYIPMCSSSLILKRGGHASEH